MKKCAETPPDILYGEHIHQTKWKMIYKIEWDSFFYLSLGLNSPPGSSGGSVIYYSTYVFGRLGDAIANIALLYITYMYCLNLFHLPTNLGMYWIFLVPKTFMS